MISGGAAPSRAPVMICPQLNTSPLIRVVMMPTGKTSWSVEVVKTIAGSYADYLKERHGGSPGLGVRLEQIPLGVNPDKYHPATPEERMRMRQALHIADDEIVVLFVGRLSFHAKVHPFPIFVGVSRAARAAGRKAHLILAGWAANEHIRCAFLEGAQ